jgi:hypothetical protein
LKDQFPPELCVTSTGASGGTASVTLVNVGFAPAINVIIEGRSNPSVAFNEVDSQKLGDYFRSRHMTFVRSEPGEHVTAWGKSHSDNISGIFTSVGQQDERVAVAKPDEPITIQLSSNSFHVAFFDVIRGIINLDGNVAQYRFWNEKQVIFDEFIALLSIAIWRASGAAFRDPHKAFLFVSVQERCRARHQAAHK